jgi:Protein of unknown function (DUF3617)
LQVNRKRIAHVAGFCLALSAWPFSASAESPAPGTWVTQTAMSADGTKWTNLPPKSACLSKEESAIDLKDLVARQIAAAVQMDCHPVSVQVDSDRVKAVLSCDQPGIAPAQLEAQGTLQAQQYDLSLVGTNLRDRNGSGAIVPKLFMKYKGKRQGGC